MTNNEYSDVTPQIHALAQKMTHNSVIDTDLYSKYNVKRGLRDLDGKGVLTGLTDISTITQNKLVDGKLVPCEGELRYRGYNVKDIVDGILEDDRFGFEEVTYLLLFGDMPNEEQLKDFKKLLVQYRTLPQHFVRDVILKATSNDMMNSIARSVLTLFCYDKNANDTSIDNVLRQCIQLISVFPLLSVYGYHAYNHYQRDNSLYIHRAEPTMSTAEVILSLLRPDRHYTPLEAKVLDMALILHMEHGGGNNSTFTTHVVTSSGTDTIQEMQEKTKDKKCEVQRYKGLGEMNADQLCETTMKPGTRTLIRVKIEDAQLAEKRVSILMGDDVPPRKEWIEENVEFSLEDDYKI